MSAAATLTIDEDPRELLRRTRASRARADFAYFVRLVRPRYAIQWFHDVIMAELQRSGLSEENARLGLALPPGHGKSEYAILYCAWMVARDPSIQIKYLTYSTAFSRKQFKRLKLVLNDERYIHYFGRKVNERRVVTDEASGAVNTKERFEIVGGTGWVEATGFGGDITGSRCDVIVIDDPFKRSEVRSPTIREHRWQSYVDEVCTRKRPDEQLPDGTEIKRPLRILMLFTRWHMDDLTGRCQRLEPEAWRFVEIEALRMPQLDERKAHPVDDPREPGEALWPAVAKAAQIEKVREIAESSFWAPYQQFPQPPGGTLFKHAWLEREWTTIEIGRGGRFLQSWDFRHGGAKDAGSFAVGLLAWQYHDEPDQLYLVDMVRERWDPSETISQFAAHQELPYWGSAEAILVEKKGDGVGVLSHFGQTVDGLVPVSPSTSKVARARLAVPYVARPCLVLRANSSWVPVLREEMELFSDLGSGTGNDDIVDAVSQLVDYVYDASGTDEDDTRTLAQKTWDIMMGQAA